MARLSDRNALLKSFGLTETLLGHFTDPDAAEGVWRAELELKAHRRWAEERHAFIMSEIAERHPALKVKRNYEGPPIVSRRGRTSDASVYGEQRG